MASTWRNGRVGSDGPEEGPETGLVVCFSANAYSSGSAVEAEMRSAGNAIGRPTTARLVFVCVVTSFRGCDCCPASASGS